MLKISNLHTKIDDKEITKGIDLDIKPGEIHALMGPNGSGKSTLAQTLMGHPKHLVTKGKIIFNGENLLDMEPTKRSQKGIFLAFQYPSEVTGVTIANFLRLVYNNKQKNLGEKELAPAAFRKILKEKMDDLKIPSDFMNRYLNEGFSGGEKKRCEVLQMAILEPKLVILDETDSGLDIDALRVVSEGITVLQKKTNMAILIITHYTRILNYIKPQYVHVMKDGKIVKEGDHTLAADLEKSGYVDLEN